MKKILCWLLALLLACTLALLGFSWVGAEAVAPALRDGGTAVSGPVQEAETEIIRDRVTELASIYGFRAETAMKYITPEAVTEMNRQAAAWWSALLKNGEAGETPVFDTEGMLEDFSADLAADSGATEEETAMQAEEAVNAVSECILRIVLPLRLPVIGIGLDKVSERADLGNLIHFLTGIRWAALALCALLAGLIALLESRKLRMSLKYIGSAMGAAVLMMAGGVVLYCLSGIDPLIAGASPSLSVQYGSLLSGVLVRLAVYAAILAVGCVVSLILVRRPYAAKAD